MFLVVFRSPFNLFTGGNIHDAMRSIDGVNEGVNEGVIEGVIEAVNNATQ